MPPIQAPFGWKRSGMHHQQTTSSHILLPVRRNLTRLAICGGSIRPSRRERNSGVREVTGVMYQRSQVSFRQIADGTSKTYMCGEKALRTGDYETGTGGGDNETWCTGFNNDNFRKTARGVKATLGDSFQLQDDTTANGGADYTRLRLAHSGGMNMALCDGSVQTIRYDIDWQVHRDMGNRARWKRGERIRPVV